MKTFDLKKVSSETRKVIKKQVISLVIKGKKQNEIAEIELFFGSPFSPGINPDEYLNHNLKQNIHSGIIPHTKEQIQHKTEKFMQELQKCRKKVSCFFKHKKLKYIQIYGH